MAKYRSFILNPLGRSRTVSRAKTFRVYLCTPLGGAGPPYPVACSLLRSPSLLNQLLDPSVNGGS